MSVADAKGARRRMKVRYKGAGRQSLTVAQSVEIERLRAVRETARKKKK